jgi:hypothetical protein
MTDKDLRNRTVQHEKHVPGPTFMLNVRMTVYRDAPDYAPVDKRPTYEKIVDRCCFVELGDIADKIRGNVPDCEGTPIMFIGDSTAKHYYRSHDPRDCPVDVLEWLENSSYAVFENIDGGWSPWEGRPEFSDTEINYRNATRVDLPSIINERRGDE